LFATAKKQKQKKQTNKQKPKNKKQKASYNSKTNSSLRDNRAGLGELQANNLLIGVNDGSLVSGQSRQQFKVVVVACSIQ
jgi:hypothetical protein